MPTTPTIRCGVAGWLYPDWKGYVYEAAERDPLRFVAGFVDVIEINSTFYRPASPSAAQSWLHRTADRPVSFSAKLHQDITHLGHLDPGTLRAVRAGMEPLAAAGRLSHLLAQFRYDFADSPANRAWLSHLHDAFGDLAVLAFELRHASWERPDAQHALLERGATIVHLDYPLARDSFAVEAAALGDHAYLRLHGRNADAWFSRGAGRDQRYDYLYSEREMDRLAERATQIAALSKTLTLVANNHYRGKEMVNAMEARARLQGRRVPVPPLLAERYPRLNAIAEPGAGRQPGLFD